MLPESGGRRTFQLSLDQHGDVAGTLHDIGPGESEDRETSRNELVLTPQVLPHLVCDM